MEGAVTRMRAATAALVILASAAGPAATQSDTGGRSWVVSAAHWGRWVGLAGAGALIGLAAANHKSAQSDFADLEVLCREAPDRCQIVQDPDGLPAYSDPQAESLYQAYARGERAARGYLLGGQLSLIAAGGMFIIDFLYGDRPTKNIPYTPLEVYTRRDRLGLTLRF